jgi:hypothetical protein
MTRTLFADRASLGSSSVSPPSSPLRVVGAPSWTSGDVRLAIDANGNVHAGALDATEIPSVFTRDDTAETISQPWTWSAAPILFTTGAGSPAAPTVTLPRSSGARVVVYPGVESSVGDYAIGIEPSSIWSQTVIGGQHKWYSGATTFMRLNSSGALVLENGLGSLYLRGTALGGNIIADTGTLNLQAGSPGVVAGNISVQCAPYGTGMLHPTPTYAVNLGRIDRKWLTVHAAELWVESLVAQDTIATIGGRVIVGPTTILTRDVAPSDSTIYVKHNSFKLHVGGVEFGSKLFLQSDGKFEAMYVLDGTTPGGSANPVTGAIEYGYSVQRDRDGSGANQWYAGDAVIDTGKFDGSSGFIDLYSINGLNPSSSLFGPTIVGNVRTGAFWYDWRERWAIGNLDGLYGNTGTIYGVAFGSPTSGLHMQIDATNGIRFLDSGNLAYGSWDMSGIVTVGRTDAAHIVFAPAAQIELRKAGGATTMLLDATTGDLSLTGNLKSGASSYSIGAGYWLGYNAGTPQLRIGQAPATNARYFAYDGSTLRLSSDGLTIDENGMVLTQSGGAYSAGSSIRWGVSGLALYDMGTSGAQIIRTYGKLDIRAHSSADVTIGGGELHLAAGGSGVDRFEIQVYAGVGGYPTVALQALRLSGANLGIFRPYTNEGIDLGTASYNYRLGYFNTVAIRMGGAAPSYALQVGIDDVSKPTSSTWTITPSDRRFKRSIVAVDPERALELVRRVPLATFEYNADAGPSLEGQRAIGVIADEVVDVLPHSITQTPDGRSGFNAHELFVLTTAAVQALARRLDELTKGRNHDAR